MSKGPDKLLTYVLFMQENCFMHFASLTGPNARNANDIIWLWPRFPPPGLLHLLSLSPSWLRQTGRSSLDHLPSPDTLWFIANYLPLSIIDYSVILLALLNLLAPLHRRSQGGPDTNRSAMRRLAKMDWCSFMCKWVQSGLNSDCIHYQEEDRMAFESLCLLFGRNKRMTDPADCWTFK